MPGTVDKARPARHDRWQVTGRRNKEHDMTFHIEIVPLLSLVAGIAILIVPKLLNYIVAIYLIALGVLGLLGHGF